MTARQLYQHILRCPMSAEQIKLSKDVKLNKLGSYKVQNNDEIVRLLIKFPR